MTSDFFPKINRSNMAEHFAQASNMTLEMIDNIGLAVKKKKITPYERMVETFGDVFCETSGIQRGTEAIPVLHCPKGAEQIEYYRRLPVINLEYLLRLIYSVLAGYPLWLLHIRDTPFHETEFAKTDAGKSRSGAALKLRRDIWEQLRMDTHVTVDVPQRVLDRQSDGLVERLEGKGKGKGRKAGKR